MSANIHPLALVISKLGKNRKWLKEMTGLSQGTIVNVFKKDHILRKNLHKFHFLEEDYGIDLDFLIPGSGKEMYLNSPREGSSISDNARSTIVDRIKENTESNYMEQKDLLLELNEVRKDNMDYAAKINKLTKKNHLLELQDQRQKAEIERLKKELKRG